MLALWFALVGLLRPGALMIASANTHDAWRPSGAGMAGAAPPSSALDQPADSL
jgi:hypothetical protein